MKNKGAMAGLVVIIIAVFTAVFCYFIAPDGSPYSNRIILEIGGEKPGPESNSCWLKKRLMSLRIFSVNYCMASPMLIILYLLTNTV
ncbi:hypothetical protein LWM68_39430 [Niabella sp. W65]|nr:hypothetical protein [Niabella sp. W65]MCH7368274.1 hypothetical protein [Niabella sp. W65]